MKAYEFPAKITSEGKIDFPEDLLKYLAVNQEVRAIVLVKEPTNSEADEVEEKTDWQRLGAKQLDRGEARTAPIANVMFSAGQKKGYKTKLSK